MTHPPAPRRGCLFFAIIVPFMLSIAAPAAAQDDPRSLDFLTFGTGIATQAAAQRDAQSLGSLTFGTGIANVTEDDQFGDFRLEYRLDPVFWGIRPMGGIQIFSEGSLYGYTGFHIDLHFDPRWVLSPNFAVGGFVDNELALGYVLQFRSGLELAYNFDDRSRLGVHFSHISNANLGRKNPGTESISLNYAIPFAAMFH